MEVLITAMKVLARISLQVAVLSFLLQCKLLSTALLHKREKKQTISAIQLNKRTNTSKSFLFSLPGIILQVTGLQLLWTH